ncbi:MAG TPA: TonB-dependent receptor, partial [Terriglobales bacterium]|nr:TonB-dependent receptor [Terriglobales bacterium]
SKIWGHHTAKFGVDLRYIQFDVRQDIEQNGVFGFDGNETGNDFADFLIGTPDSYGQASRGFTQDARAKYAGAYAQDSWRVKPNLTLNYGVRWEMSEPFYDTQNRIQAFVPGLQSVVFPDSPEGWVFPGDPGIPSTIAGTTHKNFAPRLGIAYSPGFTDGPLAKVMGGPGKMSIRAGFGMYYTSLHESPLLYETGDAPFGLFYTSPALVYLEEPFKSRTSDNDPGQRFPVPEVTGGSDIDFSTWMPVSGSTIVDRHNVLPRTTHYNLNIQRQLTSSTILTLAFVGSQGHHLITQIEANPGDIAKCLEVRALFAAAGNPDGGCGPGGEDSIYAIGGQTFYGTRPYSVTSGRHLAQGLLDFGSTLPYATTAANSSYNSFQATLEKRVGRLNFLAAYTWSKSMDNSSSFNDGTNPYNPSASKSLSAYDLTHNLVLSYVYQLPFGKWISPGFLHKVADGWAFSGITRFATGFPVTLSASGDNSLCGCYGSGANGVDVPNYDGTSVHTFNPRASGNQYFSTTPFTPEDIGVPGDSNRRFFHGPGTNNTDLSLLKDTKLRENVELQFRAEFFNVFNHADFQNPVGDISSPNFGRVLASGPGRIGQLALKLKF